MEKVRLYDECTKVRNALEVLAASDLAEQFVMSGFPRGKCGLTCRVLGPWLINHYPENEYEYISGEHGRQSHAWLEFDGIIIDITADQFSDMIDKVIITEDRSFHERFKITNRRRSSMKDLDNFPELAIYKFVNDYISNHGMFLPDNQL